MQKDRYLDEYGIIQSFPEYEMVSGKGDTFVRNMYKGIDVGKGGFVYSEPGMYRNVALLDVSSMHPHSIIVMNYFGEFTKNYKDLVDARVAIKHEDYDTLKTLLEGKLEKYTHDKDILKTLDKVLKYPINAAYGETAASFPNRFRDERNINNIVALRGALFMVDLKEEVEKRGFVVAHIKTDSIKIPEATPEIISFVQDFARQYGYEMEHEATYDRICLVNNSVYIAKYDDKGIRNKGGAHANEWTATGAEFQHPYIFKTLFSHEPIEFKDYCETKTVKDSAIYLDMNKDLISDTFHEYKETIEQISNWPKGVPGIMNLKRKAKLLDEEMASVHNLVFVGKCGSFCPMDDTVDAGILVRTNIVNGETTYASVSGTKGYRWLETEDVIRKGLQDHLDISYYRKLIDSAKDHLSDFCDVDEFING